MTHRKANNILTAVVIVFALFVMVSPFLPELLFILSPKTPEEIAPYAGSLAKIEGSSSTAGIPEENRIVIPSINLNEPILESTSIGVIKDGGTWHRPNTPTPDKPGNSVIIAHRFYGSNTSTFYHLDKVEIGNAIGVYWNNKELLYQVTEKKVVTSDSVGIEAQTEDTQLTLYTCHPLWTAKNRLVVIAKPITIDENTQLETKNEQ